MGRRSVNCVNVHLAMVLQVFVDDGTPAPVVERPFRQPGAASAPAPKAAEAPKPKKAAQESSGSEGLDPRLIALPGERRTWVAGNRREAHFPVSTQLKALVLCPLPSQPPWPPLWAWAWLPARWTMASTSGWTSLARSSG
jgi:hypothetical protein